MALLFLMASFFFKNSLIHCYFCLKLRAARLLRMHFATKSRFQQFPNLKIRSLLKIKEGLKQATEMALPVFNGEFFQNSLIVLRFFASLQNRVFSNSRI